MESYGGRAQRANTNTPPTPNTDTQSSWIKIAFETKWCWKTLSLVSLLIPVAGTHSELNDDEWNDTTNANVYTPNKRNIYIYIWLTQSFILQLPIDIFRLILSGCRILHSLYYSSYVFPNMFHTICLWSKPPTHTHTHTLFCTLDNNAQHKSHTRPNSKRCCTPSFSNEKYFLLILQKNSFVLFAQNCNQSATVHMSSTYAILYGCIVLFVLMVCVCSRIKCTVFFVFYFYYSIQCTPEICPVRNSANWNATKIN